MQVDDVQRLYAYDHWATGKILDAAAHLTTEEFLAEDDTPFGSIRNELVHIADAQDAWRGDWEHALFGKPMTNEYVDPNRFPDRQSVITYWRDVAERTDAFLETIRDDQLSRDLTLNFDWGAITAPLWEMMVHVVNHGTQHRSEVAMKLTNFGYSPGMLDIVFFSVANPVQSPPETGTNAQVEQ